MKFSDGLPRTIALVFGTASVVSLVFLEARYGDYIGFTSSLSDALSVVSPRSLGVVSATLLAVCAAAWALSSRFFSLPARLGRWLIASACIVSLLTVVQQGVGIAWAASHSVAPVPAWFMSPHLFVLAFSALCLSVSMIALAFLPADFRQQRLG